MPDLIKSRALKTKFLFTLKVLLGVLSLGEAHANIITGTTGSDFIVVGATAARVESGKADDFIIGGSGNDTFVIKKDDGKDIIYEAGGSNTVEFGTGIISADITSGLTKSGNDLLMKVGNTGQSVTVKNFFSQRDTVNQFRLSSGQVVTNTQIFSAFKLAAPTVKASVPLLKYAQAPATELSGTAAADLLIARHGTTMIKGLAADDILVPRGATVTMEVGKASGKKLIFAYEGDNTLLFNNQVAFNDISKNLSRSGDDLVLTNSKDGSQVTVLQFFTRAKTIARIRFASGGELSAAQLFTTFKVTAPTQASHYYMVSPGITFDNNTPGTGDPGGGGEPPCQGAACTNPEDPNLVPVNGSEQDDLLIADERSAVFNAGRGNDFMLGGAGNDRYSIAKGDGNDIIVDTAGLNQVRFAADIVWADISSGLMRSGNDFVLRIGQSGQTLTIRNFFTLANTIDTFKLHSGQELTRQQLFQVFSATAPTQVQAASKVVTGRSAETEMVGTIGPDILINRMAVESVDGKAGDDLLFLQYTGALPVTNSESADDNRQLVTLKFAAGHGKDQVYILGGKALRVDLHFAEGFTRDQMYQNMRLQGNDLFIKTYSETDEVRLVNFFSHYSGLEQVQFVDDPDQLVTATDIYQGFNRTAPQNPFQLFIKLPGSSHANCGDLFRHLAGAAAQFKVDAGISIVPPASLNASIYQRTLLEFSARAPQDPLLCFSVESAPAGVSVEAESGILSWAPTRAQIGSWPVKLKVHTDANTYNTIDVVVNVPDLNTAPIFRFLPRSVAYSGVKITDIVEVEDYRFENDVKVADNVVITLMQGPAGASLQQEDNNTAVLSWSPATQDIGKHTFVIKAVDQFGKASEQRYEMEVKDATQLEIASSNQTGIPKTGINTYTHTWEDGATQFGTERVYERDPNRQVVVDKITGLIWQDSADVILENYQTDVYEKAVAYCESLELGGISDWRLPTKLELYFLLQQSRQMPIPQIYPQVRSIDLAFKYHSNYRSITEQTTQVAPYLFTYSRLSVDFTEQTLGSYMATDGTRCVSGKTMYASNYVRSSNFEVAADTVNKLLWQDTFEARTQQLPWDETGLYCENLEFAGFSDWRLPNTNESQTLLLEYNSKFYEGINTSARPPTFLHVPRFQVSTASNRYSIESTWSASTQNSVFHYFTYSSSWGFVHGSQERAYSLDQLNNQFKLSPRCVRTYSPPEPKVATLNYDIFAGDTFTLDGRPSIVPEGSTVRFNWKATIGLEFGNTAVANAQFSHPGQYQIEMTIRDQVGIEVTYPHLIQVNVKALPVAVVTVPEQGRVLGNTLILDASGSYFNDGEITGYRWYALPDNTLIGEGKTVSVQLNKSGLVQYRLEILFGDGRTVTHLVEFTVSGELPQAKIAEIAAALKAGTALTLDGSGSSDSDGQIVAYRWYRLPELTLVAEQNKFTIAKLVAGQQHYRLIVEDNSGLKAEADISVVVGDVPIASIEGPAAGFVGRDILFSGSASKISSGGLTYRWSLDGKFQSNTPQLRLNLASAGNYQISLEVTSDLGFSDITHVQLRIAADRELAICPVVPKTDDRSYVSLYPKDNIPWTGGNALTVDDIAKAFNHARSQDPSVQQYLLMPTQARWNAMNLQQKGLYLVNAERVARGIKPYAGYDTAMVSVAQTYATYIRSGNQVIGHYNDGRSPMQRMLANTYINSNADRYISQPESVAATSLSGVTGNDYALARSIYTWLYEDKDWFVAFGIDGTPWGHRNHLLQTGLDDNHGDKTLEGAVGFGESKGLYQPGVSTPSRQGAVTVFKTIDQGPNWDESRLGKVDVSQAQGCLVNQLDLPADDPQLTGLKQLTVTPANLHLVVGQSSALTVTGMYQDGSQRDLSALVQFEADSYSVASVNNGSLFAERSGTTTLFAKAGAIESNRLYITVGEATDTSVLAGTAAAPFSEYIADNATVQNLNPMALSVFSGLVTDRDGRPLPDVEVSLLLAADYGSVKTNADGRFMLAGPAGAQTVVYQKANHLVLQRSIVAASSQWAALPDVMLLERDNKQSLIDLTSGTPQVHQSTLISDEFGERRATVVFNGITSAEIRSKDGSKRPVQQFAFSATEFETPASMPGELPAETAFTWASDLHVAGTHYTDSVHYNADVVLYLDNFLKFPVGEIVPVGYFDRNLSKWIASPNGVVVKLLDKNSDGVVDGIDYNDDGNADDVNSNGSTTDEAVGLAGYRAGDTLWRAAFNHMTPVDLNWSAADAEGPEAIELLEGDTGAEDEDNKECKNTGSFANPYQQSFHEDIAIAGTDLRLHYSSQRTFGYQHKIHVAVSGNNIPASMEKMIARFEIAGRVFEQEFNPAPNVEAEFIWDGTHPDGKRAEGIVSGRVSIGFEYPTVYLSSGNAATSGQPLSSFPVAWATLSDVVTQVPGRQNVIAWQQRGVSIKNTFDSQLAEGWSLSNVHEFDPKGKVYLGSGTVAEVATSSLILRTGQTYSHVVGDDGHYQAGGRNIDYAISSDNTIVDKVTGLEWQNPRLPELFRSKEQAAAYCATLPTETTLPWRLPTPKEVGYTIDKSGANNSQIIYSMTQARDMWHQNTLNDTNRPIAAVCVRGEDLDDSTITGLTRNANLDVVVDKNSGLMWQDSVDNTSVKRDWQGSIAHCEASEHAGFDDWRLPNVNELLYTLPNDVFQHYTTLPVGVPWNPQAPQRNPYWSSTTNLQDDDQAWAVESLSFNSENFKKSDAYHVRCVRQDNTSSRMPFRFNSKGQHVATFDSTAGKDLTLYQYNAAGKLSQISDSFGNTLNIERDSTGRVSAIIAPDGQRTQLFIDQHNFLTEVKYEDGSDFQFFYNERGLLKEKTDPNEYVFGRFYSAAGRVERVTAPEGGSWQFFDHRDARGVNRYGYQTAEGNAYQSVRTVLANRDIQTSTTSESGSQTVYVQSSDELTETSNSYGVVTVVQNVLDSKTLRPIPNRIVTTFPSGLSNTSSITKTYAENGADTAIYTLTAQSNGKTSTAEVNGRTGITKSTSPEGRISISYLDLQTLLPSKQSIPGLLDSTYSYDNRGRLKQSTTGERQVLYSYDAAARGQVSSVTAADGKVTGYQYDDLGRITRVTYPDGHSTQTQYDANGNAVAVIVPSLEQHDFAVNGVGNTASETRPVNSTTRYVYNRDKQLTAIELPAGERIEYGYQNGRLVSTQMPEGTSEYLYQQGDQLKEVKEGSEKVNYSYDGSLLTSLQYSGELNSSLVYGYNNDLQVNSLSYAGGSTSLSYDKDGLVTGIHGFTISYRADNGLPELLTDGKLSQNWWWNGYGEATRVQYQLDNQASSGYQLEYNKVGQIVRKTEREFDGSELVYDYAYDDRYRLTEVKQNGTVIEAYQFDANGNRIGFSSVLRGITNQTASYTQGDQLAQSGNATYTYDGNGRLASKTTTENSTSTTTQYQYSSSGRLLAVTTPEKAITYRHNALGQRVAKLVNGVVVEKYLWQDLTTLLAVFDASGNVKQRFEYGLGHSPVSFTQGGQRYYIQTDHLGSPRVISSANGAVVKAIRYDSYGNVISDSNPAFTIPFGFAGGLVDADTKLIRFGYRDYDPQTGRWTARDPIGFAGGDTNLYGYVLGDPVNFIDPTGLANSGQVTKVPGTNATVRIDNPHVEGQQKHAHVNVKGAKEVVINQDGTGSHGTDPKKITKNKKIIEYLKKRGFKLGTFGLIPFYTPAESYCLVNPGGCQDIVIPKCI